VTVYARVELELVDPSRNARRFYAMTVTDDESPQLALFPTLEPPAGELVLVVARGRIGKKPVTRRERFTTLDPLGARWRELLGRRRAHGYVEGSRR
jgi:predicted DNA-binding WGR domain protein